ncbi:inositol hexakisphosphate kinase 2-like [Poecilia latipinna]|uniref:Kinase n=1 Tax=Poecilia latipinna TaxID=48699 RepID=A0A3B3V584_9TELE|nr:PREDICTED: inositol hexakisphosphate kinase 2-like [Poecilia latipinna]
MSPAVEAQAQEDMDAEQKQKQQQQQQQNQLQHQPCYIEKGVMLEPFVHQVGGHCCVLRFGEQTICKPLIPREHRFYKTLPPAMRKFTPQYRGVVSVSFEEDEEGNLCLIAYPLHSDLPTDVENKDPSADCDPKRKMLQRGQMVTSAQILESEIYSKDGRGHHFRKGQDKRWPSLQDYLEMEQPQQVDVLHYSLEHSHSNAAPQLEHNPLILKCQQQHLQRMKENAKHHNQYKFILLENLTWRYTIPCVLDLKMGTQQHGDDTPEEKKAIRIRRCQQSTSATLGVRLSGMQVYHSDSGQFMFMSKLHGHKLTVADFKEALFKFFHSGRRLRRELLSQVLSQLREMQAVLESCESYRFYSSSLLIIYDGEQHRRHFSSTEDGLSEGEEEDDKEEEDEEEVEAEPKMDEDEDEEESETEGASGSPHCPAPSSDSSSGGSGSSSISQSCSDLRSPVVDVRMIDFAHTTCRHYREDSVVHEGKDSGYIFGIQNLITIISELENHSTD